MMMRMDEHPNAAAYRRTAAAFRAQDMEALGALIDDEVVWHVPGTNAMSGDVRGREALLEWFRRLRKITDGTFTLQGKMFEAGPRWIAQHLTVLFDPFDLRRVLFRCGDSTTHQAFPVDLGGNRRLRRNPPPDNASGDSP